MINDVDYIKWNFKEAKSSLINSIHPYPAKFIPEIPNHLIETLTPNPEFIVLDPFCGSGVTLQCAQQHGIPSVGVDLNPIACLISRVKTTPLPNDFLKTCSEIVSACQVREDVPILPDFKNLSHWFKYDIQVSLARLINEIDKHKEPTLNDALRFCFSSIIVRVSNQDSDTRYAYRDKGKTSDDVLMSFMASAKKLAKAKASTTYPQQSIIINKSSLLLNADDFDRPIGCVITSPPYPNAYEYWLYHKFRMVWLGFDPQEVKKQEIGTRSTYFKSSYSETDIYDFSNQMYDLLSTLFPMLAPGAFLCFVIGRSKIHGKIYNNDEIIAEIGQNIGLKHIKTLTREINSNRKSFNLSHARIKDEYIVFLQK